MSLRILSGIIWTNRHPSGEIGIRYRDNELSPGDIPEGVHLSQTRTVGAEMSGGHTAFRGDPTATVSLRQLRVVESEWPIVGDEVDLFTINTTFHPTGLSVSWSASSRSIIEEISYMIIGDTID